MVKLLKRLSTITLVLMLVLSLAACGGGDAGNGGDDGGAGNPDVQKPAELTEDEYKAKVEQIYTDISTVSAEEMADVDVNDMDAVVAAMTSMIEKVRPLYEELGTLSAPESFQSSQDKIKTGAEASVELLDLSLEMFELQSNPDAEEAAKKLTELTEMTADFQTKAQDLTTGLTEVLGAI